MLCETAKITDSLKCEHCLQPFVEYYSPRILPCCQKTVCYNCVQLTHKQLRRRKNKFKCVVCGKDETMPKNEFKVNKEIVELFLKNAHENPLDVSSFRLRGPEASKLKQNLRSLENLVNKLIFEIENGNYLITENCKQLKSQIQLAKEERINEINKQYDALFLKIDSYEEMCKSKYKGMNEPGPQTTELIKIAKDSIQQQEAYLRRLTIDDEEIIANNSNLTVLKAQIEKKRNNIKRFMYGDQVMKFEANKTHEEILGKLILRTLNFNVIILILYFI